MRTLSLYKFSPMYGLAILLLGLIGCEQYFDNDDANRLIFERKTTAADIAVNNLDGQISSYQRTLVERPRDMATRKALLGLLLFRIQFFGQFDDFDRAFDLVEQAKKLNLNSIETALLHAKVLSSVHRFDEALAELERAEALGASDIQAQRINILLAQGKQLSDVEEWHRKAVDKVASYSSFSGLAIALAANSKFNESESTFKQALAVYRDVSPFPVAWVNFQLGIMWGESADNAFRATAYYRDAIERLPGYIVANVHLAEMEVEQGNTKRAVNRLLNIVETTSDPEPASRLAWFLREQDAKAAAVYAERARVGYERYLSKYPLAFADHAAEFYMGAGENPNRAWQLAMLNLNNRQTARAYKLVVDAGFAAGKSALACKALRQAESEIRSSLRSLLDDCD